MNLLDSWIEKIALLTQYKTGKIRLIDYIKLFSFALRITNLRFDSIYTDEERTENISNS